MIHLIQTLAKKIGQHFFKDQLKNEYEQAKFEYGLLLFIEILLDIIGFVILGLLFDCLDLLVVYLTTFGIVRMNAGGYHAKTFIGCFLSISGLALVSIEIMSLYSGHHFTYLILGVLSGALIMIMAPLDTETKPLSDKRKQKCKVKTIYFTLATIMISIFLYVLGYSEGFKMMSLALLGQMLTMIPLFYKYKKGEKYYEKLF